MCLITQGAYSRDFTVSISVFHFFSLFQLSISSSSSSFFLSLDSIFCSCSLSSFSFYSPCFSSAFLSPFLFPSRSWNSQRRISQEEKSQPGKNCNFWSLQYRQNTKASQRKHPWKTVKRPCSDPLTPLDQNISASHQFLLVAISVSVLRGLFDAFRHGQKYTMLVQGEEAEMQDVPVSFDEDQQE